jgi:putative membrane protein
MKRSLSTVTAVCCLLALSSIVRGADADEHKKHAANKDHEFVVKAAMGGEMEVVLGKLAASKGSSDDVKKFGQTMVDDHSKANEELKSLAQSKNIDLSKAQERASKQSQKMEDKLSAKQGSDFDKAYMSDMVEDHEKDAKEFEKASKDCEDSDIKAFAAKTLPTLQHHLEMAKDIQSKLGK